MRDPRLKTRYSGNFSEKGSGGHENDDVQPPVRDRTTRKVIVSRSGWRGKDFATTTKPTVETRKDNENGCRDWCGSTRKRRRAENL